MGRLELDLYDDLPALRRTRAPALVGALSMTLVAFALALVIGLVIVPWQQSVRGQGRVVGYAPLDRQQTVDAPVDGRVVQFSVREGTKLRAGDVIAEISDLDPLFAQRLELERAAAQARRAAALDRKRAVEERVTALQGSRALALDAARARADMAGDRLAAAEQLVSQAEAAVVAAANNQARIAELAAKGLRSVRDRELADLEAARATTERERARAALQAARSERAALQADREKVGADATAAIEDARASWNMAKAEVAAAEAEIVRVETRLSRQASQRVVAPRDGTVLRLLVAQDGQIVKQGDPLIVLVPDDSDRAVELWVDGNDAPLITPGRVARVQFEGWPALQFVGWPSVAVGTFGGRVALVDAADDGSGKFRVVVVPDPAEPPWPGKQYLRQGVRANGWILLDQVSIGFEVWRQMNGFAPTVARPAGEQSAAGARE